MPLSLVAFCRMPRYVKLTLCSRREKRGLQQAVNKLKSTSKADHGPPFFIARPERKRQPESLRVAVLSFPAPKATARGGNPMIALVVLCLFNPRRLDTRTPPRAKLNLASNLSIESRFKI